MHTSERPAEADGNERRSKRVGINRSESIREQHPPSSFIISSTAIHTLADAISSELA